jgi:hypothetical protein
MMGKWRVDFWHTPRLPCFLGSPRVSQKPTRPTHSAKNVEGDFGKFTNFMKRLVAVPHSEIKAKLDAEKRAKARKSSRTSASRASSGQQV